MEITIEAPRNFSFRRTALSHGWYDLPPFGFDASRWALTRVIALDDDRAVTVEITGAKGGVAVRAPGRPGKRDTQKITRDVRHMLRLDDDMSPFYSAVRREPDFKWIARAGAGRLLRSPTVFEDVVKTICTTNCSWALTKKMVGALVEHLGERAAGAPALGTEGRAFPTAQAMAAADDTFYRDVARAGYRGPYLRALATGVARGDMELEELGAAASVDLSDEEVEERLLALPGVGPYAAAH